MNNRYFKLKYPKSLDRKSFQKNYNFIKNSDLSSVDGEIDDQSGDGECSGGDSGFTFRWDITENYTGDSYSEEGNEDEIRDKWSDQGHGRGSWKAMITAQINSPPGPVIGDIVDSDEEFVITWTLMTYDFEKIFATLHQNLPFGSDYYLNYAFLKFYHHLLKLIFYNLILIQYIFLFYINY